MKSKGLGQGLLKTGGFRSWKGAGQFAGLEEGEHDGMNIGRAADRRGVPQQASYRLDAGGRLALGVGRRCGSLDLLQKARSRHRSCPGSEVLGREVITHDGADIGIDVIG